MYMYMYTAVTCTDCVLIFNCASSCTECHRESDEQRKRHKAAEDIFGTNLLPKLEKFTFKVQHVYI